MLSAFTGFPWLLRRLLRFGARMALLLPLYTVTRLQLFWFSRERFPEIGTGDLPAILWHGLPFDIAAVLMVNMLYYVLIMLPWTPSARKSARRWTDVLFVLSNGVALALNIADAGYYNFSLRRTSFQLIHMMRTESGFMQQLPAMYRDFTALFWILLLAIVVLIAIAFLLRPFSKAHKETAWGSWLTAFLLGGMLVFTGGRGGVQRRPLWLVSVGQHLNVAAVPLVTNTPFTLLKSLHKERLDIPDYRTEAEYSPLHSPRPGPILPLTGKPNIVIILLESFSAEFTGFLNTRLDSGHYRGYTPFLDSLANQGMSFRAYANGTRSIEALPAVFCGLPNLMDRDYIQSVYADNHIESIASLLRPEGFHSAFFHGGDNGTMSFDDFTGLVGFDEYFGRDEYGNDGHHDGSWGIFDHYFLDFMADRISEMPQPFLASVLTISSHHPYTLPELQVPGLDTIASPMARTVRYADHSLGLFFRKAEQEAWFSNTIFVITADHSTSTSLRAYNNILERYAIPLVLYIPGWDGGGLSERFAQQTDILPTLLHLLGYERPHIAFGQSVADTTAIPFAVEYSQDIYQLYRQDCLIQFDGEEMLRAYRVHLGSWSKELSGDPPADVLKNLDFLKAYIREYNTRMAGNRLIP